MESVAWINTKEGRRVFYTSLGDPRDFQLPAFRRLLLNGTLWALDMPVPPDSNATKGGGAAGSWTVSKKLADPGAQP